MTFVLVHHKVKDFDQWKPGFEDHMSSRKKAGSKGGQVFRSADDPNDVVVLLEWEDLDAARRFVDNPELPELMQKHGVIGKPAILFLEEDSRPGG